MKAFVTGGSGFVGRNLIRALHARGDEVRALARSDRSMQTVAKLGATAVRGDLGDAAGLRDGMRGCDVVFHAAAEVTGRAPRERFEQANVIGTRNVLAAAREANVPVLVHVSTEAVLADGSSLKRVDETHPRPLRPLPGYPETKARAEALVQQANSPELRTVIVRPRFIWGADDTSVLAQLVGAVRSGRFVWMNHGRYLSSTCHVANLVEGMLLAAQKGRGGEIYFLTDGEPVEFRDFVTRMLATQGVQIPDRSVPFGAVKRFATLAEAIWSTLRLPGFPPLLRMEVCLIGQEMTVSDAKARRELGYRGSKSIEQGLRELAQVATISR